MLLERRTVSRKTPNDGKLEISRETADAVASAGTDVTVTWSGRDAPASIVAMTCTCAKGTGAHQHVFLQSELLKGLDAGADVDLRLEEGSSRVSVTPSR